MTLEAMYDLHYDLQGVTSELYKRKCRTRKWNFILVFHIVRHLYLSGNFRGLGGE